MSHLKHKLNHKRDIYLGQISFFLLEVTGLFKPSTWNSGVKRWFYRIYSLFTVTISFVLTISTLIFIFQNGQDAEITIETTFQFIAIFNIFCKMISILVQNKTAVQSVNLFMDKLCQPRDNIECEILQNTSHSCRLYTVIYLAMLNFSATLFFMFSPSTKHKAHLPFNVWTPYSLDSRYLHLLTYIHQGVVLQIGACVTCSIESLAIVIIWQICAQCEIFMHRLNSLPNISKLNYSQLTYQTESKFIKECVNHHLHIFSIADKLNELYSSVVFVQFFVSLSTMGVTIFQLSKSSSFDLKSFCLLYILLSSLMQIFLYTFVGEKIMAKSLEIGERICEINWISVTNRTKKDLILIMIRASRPIKFSGLKMVIMSLDTFVQSVKCAFSAYNLLKGF